MESTRERLLTHLKRYPGAAVGALAQRLALAPMTIRQHLVKMSADGLIQAESDRRPTGRPAYAYYLTPLGQDRFPSADHRFANSLLNELGSPESTAPANLPAQEKRLRLIRRAGRSAAAPHRQALSALQGRVRAEAATAILAAESGFTELSDPDPDGVQEICEYNCVYRRIVQEHDDVCAFHVAYVGELLGVPVTLESCQSSGANLCRFRPVPANGSDQLQEARA